MDIAAAVEQIYDGADFRRADTYQSLWNTWKDARSIPSQAQLADAWKIVLENDFKLALEKAEQAERIAILQDTVERNKLDTDARLELLIESYIGNSP